MMKTYTFDQLREAMFAWRGLEEAEACGECGGSGIQTYASTATWTGGIGGQSLTLGVCDHCWGSGNRHRPWPSHRLLAAVRIKPDA